MIAYIQGKLLSQNNDKVIILTNHGVGYEIFIKSFFQPNEDVTLYISHIIKEAAQELYGFEKLEKKLFFETLLKVKGVGPKMAFNLSSFFQIQDLVNLIQYEDIKTLTSAPGVGKKIAQQIIFDLKDKLHDFQGSGKFSPAVVTDNKQSNLIKEAALALESLGFSSGKFMPVILELLKTNNVQKSDEIVKFYLKNSQ
jgi:Holliday junction DNA helicase RuvA